MKFKKIKNRMIFWFLLVSILPVTLGMTTLYFLRVQFIKKTAFDKLIAIRDLKVSEINLWINNEIREVEYSSNSFEVMDIESVLSKTEKAQDEDLLNSEAREFLKTVNNNNPKLKEVFIVNSSTGVVEISSDPSRENIEFPDFNYLKESIEDKGSHITDIFFSDIFEEPSMIFFTPIKCIAHDGKHKGDFFVVYINLQNSIYPILENRIGLGETGETFIVNKDGLALSKLRWHDDAPLNFKIQKEHAMRAMQGETGIVESIGYREVEVLAAYTYIPKTRWGFVVKQDLKEVYAPIQSLLYNILLFSGISSLLGYLIAIILGDKSTKAIIDLKKTALEIGKGRLDITIEVKSDDEIGLLAQSFNKMVKDLKELTVSKKKLLEEMEERKTAERLLQEEEEKLRTICVSAIDAIVMMDEESKIAFWNPAAERIFGYSKEEIIGKDVHEMLTPASYKENYLKGMEEFRKTGTGPAVGKILELTALRKGGVEFPISISISSIQVKGEWRAVAIIRDITEIKKAEQELKESESRFRTLIENSAVGILIADVETKKFKYANPASCKMLGYSEEEFNEMKVADIHPKDKLDYVISEFEAQAKGEKTLAKNLPCLKKDGTLIYMDFSATASIIDGVKCNIGFVRDVTKEKQMEEDLLKSEESLKEAQKIAKLGNWEWDIKSDLTLWSDEMYRIFDKNPEEFELKSKNTLDCINPDDMEIISQAINLAINGNKTFDIEYRIVLKDGEIHIIHEKGEVFYDEAKEPIRIIGTCQDITERKKVEKQIREYSQSLEKVVKERTEHLDEALNEMEKAKEQVDGILKAMPEGLIYTDTNNRIILMNRAAEDLLNTRLSDLINKSIDYAIEDKTLRDKFNYTLDKKMTGYQFDFTIPGEDPEHPRILRATTSVIRDKLESLRGIVTIIQDVTHEREVDRMKTEFITTAAHELRTPLTAIRGFSEILLTKEGHSPEKLRKFLTNINKGAESLTNIINELLDISRMEQGRGVTLNKSWCIIDTLIEEAISGFRSQIKKHSLEYVPSEESEKVYVDREKIQQVMTNLLSNAIKYSPDGGLIKVVCDYQIIYYIVSVEDQGLGMKPEHVARIFEKFFRVDMSNTSVEGTGLGMSIVKHIVEAHEGRVWVESKLGEGTKVSFAIPIDVKNKTNNI